MPIKIIMDYALELIFILKAWCVVVLVIGILGNWKLAKGDNEHAGRKLVDHVPGFISIDCGATKDYLDDGTGISYKSDTGFIDTGTNFNISPENYDADQYYGRQTRNLRSFPHGKKNCYTLKPEQGKNSNYLINFFFYYGNYDKKNKIPKFDLYVGVNYMTTIQTEKVDSTQLFDVIHVPTSDIIYVCLVNTGTGIPFISALELRPLDKSLYPFDFGALTDSWRFDLGTTTDKQGNFIRYKNDVYDRMWYTFSKLSNSVLINTSSNYVCFHFAEIAELTQGKKREFIIDVNGGSYTSDPITLDYLKPLSICLNQIFEGGQFNFVISATTGSDLPPILNAFELYNVIPQFDLHKPTNSRDVAAIKDIKQTLRISREDWQADPCVPIELTWSGLTCNSSDDTPIIISLNLSSSKLTGEIPFSLSNLTALQHLDLSYNELTGSVPKFLAQLPNLKTLNLSGNQLNGSIPEDLIQKSRDGSLVFSFGEKPDLCLSVPCTKEKKKPKRELIVALVATSMVVLVLLLLIFCALAIYKRKRRERASRSNFKIKNRQYNYSEVVRITDNFKTIIGEGGFGKVYLGILKDETQVAVKLLSASSKQGYKEFRAEAQLLMIVHHKNLVSLVGYCDEGENKALIYEYMANGNLQQGLSVTNTNVLNWNQRLQIAMDAAHGLEYLHNGCKPPIIHRDLKTSNILLNEKMQAKIADFGLSRAFATENDSHVSTGLAGTLGYLDPESQATGKLNKKSDVYSFGIVLFELITGRPAIMRKREESTHILNWVYPMIESGDIGSIVDSRLHGEFYTNSAWKAVEIAMSCIPSAAIQRPDMSQVLVELKECLALEMAHGRSQTMATEANEIYSMELQSDIAALVR
ncbi:putative leucine-rich repeat receptor-like serine/threonine-protein kinase At2g19230 isoform X2 [Quercus robur]|uniref:putative leucine-rich repeat receptor-like serine/threonine-protein kinase At2g19230 isoform X2 n=1 Tax=Quercus robur TaxID=38942 RepID=UPI002162BF14|nr:putative leucine-rich repeat receptor-like serine/threonine-protein kinase At2g19230 isoform X2 [Quercus robur]